MTSVWTSPSTAAGVRYCSAPAATTRWSRGCWTAGRSSFVGGQDVTEDVLVQADGKIIVTGWPVVGNSFHFTSMRFTDAGDLDLAWGGDGVVSTTIGFNERAYSALLQPDQKLVIAGGLNQDSSVVLARYLNDAHAGNPSTTTITAHTPAPSWPGQPVQVSYTVTAASGTPSGNVTVSDGVNACTGTVAAGGCSVALATLGTRQLTASYAGAACTSPSVSAAVAHSVENITFTVTPSAVGGGTLDPATPQVVNGGQPTSFQVQPSAGHRIQSVSGCGGTLNANTYSIASVASTCTVTATFNRNPVAIAMQISVLEDSGGNTGMLQADDDDALTFSRVTTAMHGTALVNGSGTYLYSPAADYNGGDSFRFKVSDGVVESAPADVTITVVPVNDAPGLALAASPSHPAASSGARTVAAFAAFDAGPADEDATQSLIGYQFVSSSDPAGVVVPGSVAIDAAGTLTYQLTGVGGSASFGVRARDDGGTANGGNDLSPMRTFTISVAPGADLQIAKDDQRDVLIPGQTTTYAIVVANAGPNAVVAARLVDDVPALLSGVTWACVAAQSTATCPLPATGSGDLDTLIDLASGTFVRFDVTGTVDATPGQVIVNTASVTTPDGVAELDGANNSATDQAEVRTDQVFGDGFESATTPFTVPGAAAAMQ
jgi:uncharacterized repeat protein (TIGR01451 family)